MKQLGYTDNCLSNYKQLQYGLWMYGSKELMSKSGRHPRTEVRKEREEQVCGFVSVRCIFPVHYSLLPG